MPADVRVSSIWAPERGRCSVAMTAQRRDTAMAMSRADKLERWRQDGWGADTRLGVLTPHADVGPESELQAMSPEEVAIHASRVPFAAMAAGGGMDPTIPLAPVRAFAEPPFV